MSHGMSQNTLIAVVEDDAEIRALVRGLLCREGFEAVACTGGGDLDRLMEQRRGGFFLARLKLAGGAGLAVFPRLPRPPRGTPGLFLTAQSSDVQRPVSPENRAHTSSPHTVNAH